MLFKVGMKETEVVIVFSSLLLRISKLNKFWNEEKKCRRTSECQFAVSSGGLSQKLSQNSIGNESGSIWPPLCIPGVKI